MINIQNIGNNKCFKWCSGTYFNPTDHSQRAITKVDKDFAKLLDFKEDIKFPAKIKHIHKIENNSINISVSGYKKKGKCPIYVSKQCCEENHVDLSLLGEDKKNFFSYQRFQ